MSDREKDLLEGAKSGDVAAFEQLIESYQKKIFNMALRMLGNYDDAGDLTQEVLIRIYKSIRSFKEQSSFSTWIYRITTNVCLDEIRRRKNRKVISLDEEIKLDDGDMKRQIESDEPSPEETAEAEDLKKIVNDAIARLSEEHRIAIVLRDIQGLSYEEIAEVLKCPEGTVKSRINRARQALKNVLASKRELLLDGYVK
ncbi:MAG: sigma-70 family RNA polymerase sigma factor [Ruminiclostridium sp.]|nr:sigma-70 family RNA polymerase sigma factor [Ruminiclostridium sp.]